MSAETGVGPSIASGSHTCSGNWADLPTAPANTSNGMATAHAPSKPGAPGFEGAWAVAIPLLVFAGAVGKSAQFPLHVWLPDAMEGPTPVSALIHAATMVAAGVYLVARAYPLFEAAPVSLDVVAYIGAFTALMS